MHGLCFHLQILNALLVGRRATSRGIVQTVLNQVRSATPVDREATSPEIAQMLTVKEMTMAPELAATSVEGWATFNVTVVPKNATAAANLGILLRIAKTTVQCATSVIRLVTMPANVPARARPATTVERPAT